VKFMLAVMVLLIRALKGEERGKIIITIIDNGSQQQNKSREGKNH